MTLLATPSGPAARPASAGDGERLRELRSRIDGMQGPELGGVRLPVPEALSPLFPAGLRAGGAYRVEGSNTLLLALLAASSAEGSWCGAVGIPELGIEAAAAHGVELERLVLVPSPGRQWLSVVAALVDALGVVAVRPPSAIGEADAARLAARLRQHDSALLVLGPWPRAEAVLRVAEEEWEGIGRGHGHLGARRLRLSLSGRSGAGRIRELLGEFDRLVGEVPGNDQVVTHGEPHPGNVLRGPAGPRLIDWDTVQLAPPERDLWLLPDALHAEYTRRTGRPVSAAALALYRLRWQLADIAVYVDELRRARETTEDTTAAWTYLNRYLA